MTTLDHEALKAAIGTKLVGQFWPGETALESEDHNWQQYRGERYEQIITAYLDALSSLPKQGVEEEMEVEITGIGRDGHTGKIKMLTIADDRYKTSERFVPASHPAAVGPTDEVAPRKTT